VYTDDISAAYQDIKMDKCDGQVNEEGGQIRWGR
jgi:hypothetical protein